MPFLELKNRLSILTHHLHNTKTLENQKCIVLYYVYITKYQIIQNTEFFSWIPKLAVILIFKHLCKFLEQQHMLSKVYTAKTRLEKLKTKRKDKTKIENVGMPSAYLFTRRAGHVTSRLVQP